LSSNSSTVLGELGVQDLLLERAPSPASARMAYTSEKHPRSTFSELNLVRKRQELCDVVLLVGNRKIFAHKVILAACSPYFRAMFTGELAESRQTEIAIRDVDESAMEVKLQLQVMY
jgi:kelch-like protein 20